MTSDLIDASAEVDTDFNVIEDVDVLDNDEDVDIEFSGLDPDFDALDTPDPDLFL
jgi:hypothetical protein